MLYGSNKGSALAENLVLDRVLYTEFWPQVGRNFEDIERFIVRSSDEISTIESKADWLSRSRITGAFESHF